MIIYALLFLSSISAAVGQLLLKQGMSQLPLISIFNRYVLLGFLFYAFGLTLWMYGLSKASLSLVYSFTLLTFVMVFLFSAIFLNESIKPLSLCGIGIIAIGFLMILKGQS